MADDLARNDVCGLSKIFRKGPRVCENRCHREKLQACKAFGTKTPSPVSVESGDSPRFTYMEVSGIGGGGGGGGGVPVLGGSDNWGLCSQL